MKKEQNFRRPQKQALTIPVVMGSFLLMLFNAGGTVAWINIYTSGIYTEWWVFALIAVCGLATLIFASKFAKSIRGWLF